MSDIVQEATREYESIVAQIQELEEAREEAALKIKDAVDALLRGGPSTHLGDAAVARSNGNGNGNGHVKKSTRSPAGRRRKDRSAAERESDVLALLMDAGLDGAGITELKKAYGTKKRLKGFSRSLKKLLRQGHLHEDGGRYFIGTPSDAMYA